MNLQEKGTIKTSLLFAEEIIKYWNNNGAAATKDMLRNLIITNRMMLLESENLHSIRELNLKTRANNCLLRASIDTIEKLQTYSELEIMKIRNMGEQSYQEVLSNLKIWEAAHDEPK